VSTIVILGGGHVCISAYRSLQRHLGKELQQGTVVIKVVCPLKFHSFNGFIAESLTGIIQGHNRRSLFATLIPKAQLIQGFAEEINNPRKQVIVRLQDGQTEIVRYDYLLLGFGSVDSDVIAGVKDYGFQLKSQEGFEKAFYRISTSFKQASNTKMRSDSSILKFIVAGAGFAGIEVAANLAEFIKQAKSKNPALGGIQSQVHLIVSGSEILPSMDASHKRLKKYTLRRLKDLDVLVTYNKVVVSVTKNAVTLDDGTVLPCNMVLSTVGQSQLRIKGTEKMLRDDSSRLLTNEFLQLDLYPRIWGGGDACCILNTRTGQPCQPDALGAIHHGKLAGTNIARTIQGKAQKPFIEDLIGQTASLGIGKGITSINGKQFTGVSAWCLRWVFFHYCIPSRKSLFSALRDWIFFFVTGKRIRFYQV